MNALSGALINSATLSSGALLSATGVTLSGIIQDGGIIQNGSLGSGATEYVTSGGTVSGQNNHGGTRIVSAGGTIAGTNTYIQSGGTDQILSGGVDSGGLYYNGTLAISAGGTGINNFINYGTATAADGSVLSNTTFAGGILNATTGTILSGTISAGNATLSGGTLTGSNTTETLSSGSIHSGAAIGNGASLSLLSGASANTVAVNSAGTLSATTGATITSATIATGGLATLGSSLLSGAITNAGVISQGNLTSAASETILAGGTATDQTIFGTRTLSSGGIASNGVLWSGGTDTLLSGASAFQGSINSGGVRILNAGASNTNPFITSGGTLSAAQGALITSATISTGGLLNAAPTASGGIGAILSGTINNAGYISAGYLSGSGTVETITAGGVVQDQRSLASRIISSGGILRNGAVSAGGVDTILAGGSTYQGYVSSGGTRNIASGGTATDPYIGANGVVNAASGAQVLSAEVFQGGTLNAASGSLLSGAINISGGLVSGGTLSGPGITEALTSGGSALGQTIGSNAAVSVTSGLVSAATLQSGATLRLDGGVASSTTVDGGTIILNSTSGTNNTTFTSNGGTLIFSSGFSDSRPYTATNKVNLIVSSGATVSGTTIQSGGSTYVVSGGTLANTTTVSSGGALVLNGTAGSGTINLAGDGAALVISGTSMPTNTISGFTTSDTIDLASIPRSAITNISRQNNQITISTRNQTYTLNAPGASSYGYQLQDDGKGGTIYTTCFARGTHIATPTGTTAVESLQPGDTIATAKGPMPVKWTGHRTLTVADQRVPEENWLIRIKAGALADNTPSRDLLITQEHCMVFDGKLVPARMLVNNASIIIDRSIDTYTYFHIELDTHEAIWAEGALTESYLDTGNRAQFENNPVTAAFPADLRSIGGSETLPLDTSRSFVEPLHAAILARANTPSPIADSLTDDAALHLITNTGAIVKSRRIVNNQHVFLLPEGTETVILASRTARPSDTIGPFVDDRRDLGVLVGEISLFGTQGRTTLDTHLTTPTLPGWDVVETSPCRWTNGAAILPLGPCEPDAHRILSIQVKAQGPYRADHTETATKAA